jgi:hypothetical protein
MRFWSISMSYSMEMRKIRNKVQKLEEIVNEE